MKYYLLAFFFVITSSIAQTHEPPEVKVIFNCKQTTYAKAQNNPFVKLVILECSLPQAVKQEEEKKDEVET